MAFLCRIRQTRLNYLCSQFKRSYFHISAPCLSDYVAKNKLLGISNYPLSRDLLGRPNEVFDNVRFFAAPVQVKKKVEETSSKGPRLNEQIKAHMVRLVTDEGHDIVPFHVAMEQAKRLGLDLVEVDHNAKPIVCKIMDYHRERYQQQMKEKERSKSKADLTVRKGIKEVRFSPKIDQKDLQMKAEMAKKLMERGYRVKCMVLGTEDQDLGGSIARLSALIEDVALVESGPRVERRQAYIIVRHIKFGPSKKGAKRVVSSAESARSELQKGTTSQLTGGRTSPVQHLSDSGLRASEASGSENECDATFAGESDSESTPKQVKESWSVFGANDAHEKVFEFREDLKNADSFSDQQMKPVAELDSVAPNADFSQTRMPQVPNFMGPSANSSENRYNRQGAARRCPAGAERYMQPGHWPPQTPQAPNFTGPAAANSSQNRYNRQPGPYPPQMPEAPKFTGPSANSYENSSKQPGPYRPQMPQAPNFMGPSANSSENRYSRQSSTKRGLPGTEQYTQPGPDPKSYRLPQREIPDQSPSNSDYTPPSKSYGIFSQPKATSPEKS